MCCQRFAKDRYVEIIIFLLCSLFVTGMKLILFKLGCLQKSLKRTSDASDKTTIMAADETQLIATHFH